MTPDQCEAWFRQRCPLCQRVLPIPGLPILPGLCGCKKPKIESIGAEKVPSLHPYMVHDGDPSEGAALAFAHTAREAKAIGFPVITGWNGYCQWTDVRVRRLREHEDYLMTLAQKDGPHCLDDLPTCPSCQLWGAPVVNGKCDNCSDDLAAIRQETKE